ncbi:S-layer homology domain-containing protein [Salimicrobium halophilum]|uniref:S-layer homology domain-containing protein n=1 Tax=Salimicrobium halophilum TaxID=86666 RepID=A0A1G8SF37_9BACI|nr:S-layer homology domain-containing protein [Salimicrobium halophilum]SDJ27849.1 S-layer homology domain-containing protein [Salimicrobium halophilum]
MKKRTAILTGALAATSVMSVQADDHTAADSFSDISENMTHYEAINQLYQKGVVSGFNDGTFRPNESLTRIEAALMLESALNLDFDGEVSHSFEDVPDKYNEVVDMLYEEGIFQGQSSDEFGTYDELTREQMAKVLVEAFDLQLQDVPTVHFDDRGWTSLGDYLDSVYHFGVASGYPNHEFGVGDPIKRQDFSAMLFNAMNVEDKDYEEQTALRDYEPSDFLAGGQEALDEVEAGGALFDTRLMLGQYFPTVTLEYGDPDEQVNIEGPRERYGNIFLGISGMNDDDADELVNSIAWFPDARGTGDSTLADVKASLGEPDEVYYNELFDGVSYRYNAGDYFVSFNANGEHQLSQGEDGLTQVDQVDESATLNLFQIRYTP